MTRNKTIEERYKKLTPKEHILKRPEMYIGNVYTETRKIFVFDEVDNKFINQNVQYNAGFVKLYDEVLTNASDHYIRTGKVKYIKINVEKDHIIIENDGPGIPIVMHKEHKMYVPELIFGNLLSGENFDENDQRLVGGLNGLGTKLTNIFSKKFEVKTADGKKKYVQTFTNNMENKTKPSITKSTKNYTKITYYPDFEKFELKEITEDIQSIFLKRAMDIAAYSPKVKVYYNNNLIPIKSFKDYMLMHIESDSEFFYDKINDNWEIGISKSNGSFQHVSMVNGISTYLGGKHVSYVIDNLIKLLLEKMTSKKTDIKAATIRNNLFVFVNCKIPNPVFSTQTKEFLTTKITNDILLNDELIKPNLIKKILASKIKDDIIKFASLQELQEAKKSTQDSKKVKVKIDKLDDANKAGDSSESMKCGIFLCEGDSANATVSRGLSVIGRDYYGSYPLKGKPLNVRDITLQKMRGNKEISDIITALGLEFGKKYTSTRTLRYGKVIIITDADYDGSHIKGLIINLFEIYWPELLELDFIYEFTTPIVKIRKGNKISYFYTFSEYKKWKEKKETGFNVKWIKGLGTIEPQEAKLFFKNISKHLIKFNISDFIKERDLIDLAFNKKRVDDRKNWLLEYNQSTELDKFTTKQTYDNFFNTEFIEFSMSDNIRSIPSVVDGLKPSQRKVLYTLFGKPSKYDIKVSQLTGSIMEMAAYHHGACLDYNTEILLADGTYIKIGEWCERYPDVELLLYCVDENNNLKISIGKNPISIRQELEYLELELDDGTKIECTENHKFLINDEFIKAKYLKEGMNILDFNNLEKNDF
jgi:DNA topoisomerase-2